MEHFKLVERFPLMCNRFTITLPELLNIEPSEIEGFTNECNILKISAIEYEDKNIRDIFEDINKINDIIGNDNNITIEYFGPTGDSVRKEIYENIEYLGEQYSGCNYGDIQAVTTALIFKYTNRRNATAN